MQRHICSIQEMLVPHISIRVMIAFAGCSDRMIIDSDDPGYFSIRNTDDKLQSKLDDYWNHRSRGYNLATHMLLKNTSNYDALIDSLMPRGKSGNVLDVGTGCGQMAIIAARRGHHVTAVDSSERMIYYAQRNAERFGLNIDCVRMDMNNLNLEDESYDLIIAKSSIWCLREPVKAIRRWVELIKPGGHMLIIDSNYYLGHFDSDYRSFLEYRTLQNKETNGMYGRTNIDKVNMDTIHSLASELPVCRMRRPSWDVSIMMGLGLEDITVNCIDSVPNRTMTVAGYLFLPMDFTLHAMVPAKGKNIQTFGDVDEIDVMFDDFVENDTTRLKAISDRNRLRILNLLCVADMNVSKISEITGLSMPMVSYNLRILKSSDLISCYKSGKEIYYSMNDPSIYSDILQILRK